jgi:hypothetical protein
MALPPPLPAVKSAAGHFTPGDPRRRAGAVIFRAKLVLMAIALAAAVVLVAVAWWPVKVVFILAFVRGLFASNLIASGPWRSVPRPGTTQLSGGTPARARSTPSGAVMTSSDA